MTATSMSRMVVPLIALVAAIGVALVFGLQHLRREAPVDTRAADAEPSVAKPASPARDQALAKAQTEVGALATALGATASPPPPDSSDGVPAFDIARIEPSGEAVIAGRAAPGATVELLRNGEVHDRTVADRIGQFALVPPRLPAGTYDLTLRAKQVDGKVLTSKQSVAVAIARNASDRPVVALTTPDKPTVVLSQPAAQKPAAGTVVVEAVEVAPDGKFHVSGRARPGAAVRFYLNDSFVAPVTAGADGRFAVTINKGVAPGSYRIRLDEMEQNSSTVRTRAEVPFNVPDKLVTASVPAQIPTPAARREDAAAVQPPESRVPAAPTLSPAGRESAAPAQVAAAGDNTAAPSASSPSVVVVPNITTTTVARGDSLWRISQTTYGAGIRYAVIYQANREQIRNPHLIYPGQIFVLPAE